MAGSVCPPAGATLSPVSWPLVAAIFYTASTGAMAWAHSRLQNHAGQRGLRWLVLLAMALFCAAFGVDLAGQLRVGLDPVSQAWSASVASLLAWQGLHVAVVLLMGGYLIARSASAKLRRDARATLDNVALFWHYAVVQGLLAMLTVYGLPALL
jgi:cytochrome c oxidase subunit I+III